MDDLASDDTTAPAARVERLRQEQKVREQEGQEPDPHVRDEWQLDAMLDALWDDIRHGKVAAINMGRTIIELRAKPERREVPGKAGDVSTGRLFGGLSKWELHALIEGYEDKQKLPHPKDEKLDPKDEKLDPKDEKLDPKDEKLDPKDEKLDPKDEKLDPKDEKLDPKDEKLDPRIRDDRQLDAMLAALGPDLHRGKVAAVNAAVKIMALRAKLARCDVAGATDDVSAVRPFEMLTDWDLNVLIEAYKKRSRTARYRSVVTAGGAQTDGATPPARHSGGTR